MKPPPFAYEAPRSLDAALGLLEDGAVALAGGQSLVPILNFRQIRPRMLVDLNRVDQLESVVRVGDELRLGAMTRLATIERSAEVEPLLREAVSHAGHPATRSRGTVGGSAAHADPRAELPVALTALDGRFKLRSARGERIVSAGEFFLGEGRTALASDELLTEILIPILPPGARAAFVEQAPTRGDFALAGAAVVLMPAERAAIALLGAGACPVRSEAAERALVAGESPAEVAALAAQEVHDPYRSALLRELVRRALERIAG